MTTLYTTVLIIGIVYTACIGALNFAKRGQKLPMPERTGQRFALEQALALVIFSALPLISDAIMGEGVLRGAFLRLESLFLAGFILANLIRLVNRWRRFGVQSWPLAIIILVISSIFSTIELINAVWWSEDSLYVYGLVSLVVITALQITAVTAYETSTVQSALPHPHGALWRRALDGRLWRKRAADHSDITPKPDADVDHHRISHR